MKTTEKNTKCVLILFDSKTTYVTTEFVNPYSMEEMMKKLDRIRSVRFLENLVREMKEKTGENILICIADSDHMQEILNMKPGNRYFDSTVFVKNNSRTTIGFLMNEEIAVVKDEKSAVFRNGKQLSVYVANKTEENHNQDKKYSIVVKEINSDGINKENMDILFSKLYEEQAIPFVIYGDENNVCAIGLIGVRENENIDENIRFWIRNHIKGILHSKGHEHSFQYMGKGFTVWIEK